LRLPVGLGEGVVEFAVSNGTPEGVGASPGVEGVRGAFEGEAGVPEFDSPAHDGCVDPGMGRWSKENGALHRAWNAPLAPAGETIKPKNGNEFAWIISQLSAVVLNAGANRVFFNSPTG
jgi:hypothetical protein